VERTAESIFAILVKDHELGLLGFVSSQVIDPAAAADIIQETFLAAWQQMDQFDRTGSFTAYLRAIARHKIADRLRELYAERRGLEAVCSARVSEIADEFDRQVPDNTELFQSRLAALRECLDKLQTHVRHIIDQHYIENRTCAEIAAALDRGVEAVKKVIQRGRTALARCIQLQLQEPSADVD
jgi:RNA polymerase sigma-70 factor (ECF subfamily)